MQKCPGNCTINKKSSNFVKKWTKSQTKAQKCSKVHFIREIWCSNREIGRFDEKLGDSRENRESWQVWTRVIQIFIYMPLNCFCYQPFHPVVSFSKCLNQVKHLEGTQADGQNCQDTWIFCRGVLPLI